MWSELESYVKIAHCTCGKYECGVGKKTVNTIDEEKTHQFLTGLNDESFSSVHSQVLAHEPMPSLDTIFNIIQQEENHKCIMMDMDQQAKNTVAFVAREPSTMVERPTCKHCGKYSHDETNCYEIIGYPPGWESHGRGKAGHGGRSRRGGVQQEARLWARERECPRYAAPR